jgi:aminomethyltransferase
MIKLMLKHTPLYAIHAAAGARTGEFAGYDMPLYYAGGALKEHASVRECAGLFDVSHMGQILISGDGAAAFLEHVTPSSFASLKEGKARYTALVNEDGGMIDDLIVSRLENGRFFAVVNAGRKEKDVLHLQRLLPPKDVHLEVLEERALVSLQGPKAAEALATALGVDTEDMAYMSVKEAALKNGVRLLVGRLGYTGEDGFELSVPADRAAEIWTALAGRPKVALAGLAARDSLRLEMGYPLYGRDIDESTSPVEADLAWIVGKGRAGFLGADRILREREQGAKRKRVGIALLSGGVAREGTEIVDERGISVGRLTSGGFSPSLGYAIGQAYVPTAYAEPGRRVFARIRGKDVPAEIRRMPFLAPRVRVSSSHPTASAL